MIFSKYTSEVKTVKEIKNGEVVERQRVIIYIESTDDKGNLIKIPSFLTGFPYNNYKNLNINNAINATNVICPFINWINNQVIDGDDELFDILNEKGLYGLDFYHAKCYLNYCIENGNRGKGIKRSTAKQYTNHILDFYEYLLGLGMLDSEKVKFEYIQDTRKKEKGENTIRKNPLDKTPYKVNYPSKNTLKKEKINNMDEALWQLFLQVSQKYNPEITFGIALQMFGGLRRGEVVNIGIDNIKVSKNNKTMEVIIKNRQQEFFSGRNDVAIDKCGVKKPRFQVVYNFNGKLYDYFSKHIEIRNNKLEQNGKMSKALFIDNNGNPMDGLEYEKQWSKVRRRFIKILENEAYSKSTEINNDDTYWGTHIGRGIFSNLCLLHGLAKTARELANLRGDEREESSKPYIDKITIAKKAAEMLNIMSEDIVNGGVYGK